VHMSSGFSALAACIIVGKRKDYSPEFLPHNVPFVLLGAAMLWFGWFGFNSGSALSAGGLAALAFTNTQVATGMAFITWVFLDAVVKKKMTAVGAASGAVVGLVAITPAAGYVDAPSSIAVGGIGTLVVYFVLEAKSKYFPRFFPQVDDSLDVFSCHGVGGAMGCILTGFFASKEANPAGANGVFFDNENHGILLGYQLAAITITMFFSVLATAIILLILKYTIGITQDDEEGQGLDVILHGNKAYVYDGAMSIKIGDMGDINLQQLKKEEFIHKDTHELQREKSLRKSEQEHHHRHGPSEQHRHSSSELKTSGNVEKERASNDSEENGESEKRKVHRSGSNRN